MITTYTNVLKADLKNILRDDSLLVMLLSPLLFVPLVRYGGLAVMQYYPDTAAFMPMVVMLFAALIAVFPAYVLGFVMMDEKDGGLNQVLRVLPFHLNQLIRLRVGAMVAVGFVNAILILALNGIVQLPFFPMLALAVQASLFAPIAALFMLCISTNKIEAATSLKAISFLVMLGFVQFFVELPLKYCFALIPNFWLYRAFEELGSSPQFAITTLSGLVIQSLYILLLWRWFLKRW